MNIWWRVSCYRRKFMTSLLLSLTPGLMAKYEYAHHLLKWAASTVGKVKAHGTTIDYPLMEPILLASLERVSQDLGSIDLLRFVIDLRKLNERLGKTNQNTDDTNSVLDTAFGLKDEIPKLDAALKARIKTYRWMSGTLCVVLAAVIIVSTVGPTVALICR